MTTPVPDPKIAEFRQKLLDATEALAAAVEDRGLLMGLSQLERRRLIQLAGQVFHPDPAERRRMVKTSARLRRVESAQRDEEKLSGTGIDRKSVV